MTRFVRLATPLFALVLLAGCSATTESTSSDESNELTAAPAAGAQITGDGYTFSVPEGWDVTDTDPATIGADTLAADLTDVDGFADNVNVVLSPAGAVTPEQIETSGPAELEGVGATDVKVNERVQVGGAESAHLSASLNSQGTSYAAEQYYLTNDGQTYIVTFSFSPTVSEGDRTDAAESVLASWAWS